MMSEGEEYQHIELWTKMTFEQRRLQGTARKVVMKSSECDITEQGESESRQRANGQQ